MKMASFGSGVVCAIFVLISMVVPSLATVYTVGDSTGWTMGTDYSTWTSGKTFTVGDSLVFNYGGGHTVDEVSASDYNTCTVGNAITSDNSGATTIALKTAGTHYYICGVIGHCGSGMKIAVTVKAASSSGTTTTTPSSGLGSSTTPATTSPAGTNTTIYQPSSNNMPASASPTLSPYVATVATWVALFCVMVFLL
ncbi:hypothetical protein P3X46_021274 [Hevea brasiliensis]|uniref:Phytocyanin domain-containing protein n=1 Tax=Hevea brasiliensis TaxID=3981 RepID=A0ABQ9LF05_HEVBR|nr:blue copper protein [Hevea brasiliensis]KAJ9166534.1 hypothetical protein P3X46_021274 [Hevea brasiliensis]